MNDTKPQQASADNPDTRAFITQLVDAQEAVRPDSPEIEDLVRDRTRQHALSVSVGRNTPEDPLRRFKPEKATPYDGLDPIGQFARDVNRSEALDRDDLRELPFRDVYDREAILAELARRVGEQR